MGAFGSCMIYVFQRVLERVFARGAGAYCFPRAQFCCFVDGPFRGVMGGKSVYERIR